AQKGADILVAREEADIGGALEQVPHQDVDRDLCLGSDLLQALLERLASELVEQAAGQLAEGAARAAHVRSGAGELTEQAQVVPDRLQMLEDAAVFLGRSDVRDGAFEIEFEIKGFELIRPRPSPE